MEDSEEAGYKQHKLDRNHFADKSPEQHPMTEVVLMETKEPAAVPAFVRPVLNQQPAD